MNRSVLNGALTVVPTLAENEEIWAYISNFSAMVDGFDSRLRCGHTGAKVYGRRCGRALRVH
jgi:hypothetical protein